MPVSERGGVLDDQPHRRKPFLRPHIHQRRLLAQEPAVPIKPESKAIDWRNWWPIPSPNCIGVAEEVTHKDRGDGEVPDLVEQGPPAAIFAEALCRGANQATELPSELSNGFDAHFSAQLSATPASASIGTAGTS